MENVFNTILRVFLKVIYWILYKISVATGLLLPFGIYGIYKVYVSYEASRRISGIFDTKWTFFVIAWLIIPRILIKILVLVDLKVEDLA